MTQVRDEELSALLDGELDARRAREVRAAIEADPALREEFAALAGLDGWLRGAAEEAAFMPDVAFPAAVASEAPAWRWPAGVVVVLALVAARLLPKLAELPLFGIGLQLAACAAIALIVVTMARDTGPPATPAFGKGIPA